MRVVKKKIKKPLLLAILAGILVILTVGAIVINAITSSAGDDEEVTKEPPKIIEGVEAVVNGQAAAYPQVTESEITFIRVLGDDEYVLMRGGADGEDGEKEGAFNLFYRDAVGTLQMYYPEICEKDPTFDYEELYAVEQGDDYGRIPKITYLCTAIGTAYFDERIEITENTDLERFGLADSQSPVRVDYNYTNEAGETKTRKIIIGKKNITGVGYYFKVDDRNYIYSGISNHLDYALCKFGEYISPILVAEGLAQDKAFEPYLTTDFKQWVNTVHEKDGETVVPDSIVILGATTYTPAINSENYKDGYIVDPERGVSFDLRELAKNESYGKLASLIVGKQVGKLSSPLYLTLPSYSKAVELIGGKSSVYKYRITAIESVTRDDVETAVAGETVGDAQAIKITYTLSVGGEEVSAYDMHGVLPLDAKILDSATKALIQSSKVGKLDTPIEIECIYSAENAVVRDVDILITEIIKIYDDDKADKSEVAVGTTVMYRHKIVVDGKELDGDYTDAVKITENMSDGFAKNVADALMGKKVSSGLNITIKGYISHCEQVADFISYTVSEVKYFVTRENVVSFRFEQASTRDPYYGESFYSNTMEGAYSMYALNASSCEAVVRLLGGLESNATSSTGLVGLETVDVGLTPENMKKYDLYDYTIYFELPRGITAVVYDGVDMDKYLNSLDDYTYYSTLGFNLYISKPQIDGTRYIASDMYDVVSKVNADDFIFLEMSFVEFYARRNLILTKVSDINNITLEFFMEDFYGKYSNELQHKELYSYSGKLYTKNQLTEEELSAATLYDGIQVVVTPTGEISETEFSKFLDANGYDKASLYEFYDKKYFGLDTLGTANFKELVEILFYTHYQDNFEEGDDKDGPMVMRMKVRLFEGYSVYDYVYEFYRVSDRRVMVKLYRENRVDGTAIQEVSDFYVSTFAFKKIVGAYMQILNGENIESAVPYPEADASSGK